MRSRYDDRIGKRPVEHGEQDGETDKQKVTEQVAEGGRVEGFG